MPLCCCFVNKKPVTLQATQNRIRKRTDSFAAIDLPTLSIWDIIKKTSELNQRKICAEALSYSKVAVFHSQESMFHDADLNRTLYTYLPPEMMTKSHGIGKGLTVDFKEVLSAYKMFNPLGGNGVDTVLQWFIRRSRTIPVNEISFSFSGHHERPYYLPISSQPIIVQNSKNVKTDIHYIANSTSWLQIMSWWKKLNGNFYPYVEEINKFLKAWDGRSKSNIQAMVRELDDLLMELRLDHGSAEHAVIDIFTSHLPRSPPNVDFWCLSETGAENLENCFFEHVAIDKDWVTFIVECGSLTISIVLSVLTILKPEKFKTRNALLEQVKDTIKWYMEYFYDNIIVLARSRINNKVCLERLVRNVMNNFLPLLDRLEVPCDEANITCATIFVNQMLHAAIVGIADNAMCKAFSQYNYVHTVNAISEYTTDMRCYGIYLAYKAFSGDFVSKNLLATLCEYVTRSSQKTVFLSNCARIAYSILMALEIKCLKQTAFLPSCYPEQDYRAYIRELNLIFDGSEIKSECSFMGYSNKCNAFQQYLYEELKSKLSSVSKLTKKTFQLLRSEYSI